MPISKLQEMSDRIKGYGSSQKNNIIDELSKRTGIGKKDIDRNLVGVGEAFKGAEVAQAQGKNVEDLGYAATKAHAPKEDGVKAPTESKRDLSHQETLTVALIGLLPSLVATAIGGPQAGQVAAEGGGKAGAFYIDQKTKQADRDEKNARRQEDIQFRTDHLQIQKDNAKGLNTKRGNDLEHQKKTEVLQERAVKAREGTLKKSEAARDDRINTSHIKAAQSLFSNPTINKEITKLNAARSAQTLIESIKSGHVTDSKNISKQLTNIIATIELGAPGGQGDREAMGVSTFYGDLKGLLGYFGGTPTSVLTQKYISQLENEADSLGDRAAKNYKALTDSSIKGADLSLGDESLDKGKIYDLARSRQAEFLNQNGYHPETLEKLKISEDHSIKNDAPKMVKIIDPTGKIRLIPSNKVKDAISAGGKMAPDGI